MLLWHGIAVGEALLAGAVRLRQARVRACRAAHDVRHAGGLVEREAVGNADRGGGLDVRAGGPALTAGGGPRHVVEDVAADVPVADLVGVEGAEDVTGV